MKISQLPELPTLPPPPTPTPIQTGPSGPEVPGTDALQTALAAHLGLAPETFQYTVDQSQDGFVLGTLSAGGYFLATEKAGAWTIVYDGEGTPACSAVEAFPFDLVTECLDETNNIIIRAEDDQTLIGLALSNWLGYTFH